MSNYAYLGCYPWECIVKDGAAPEVQSFSYHLNAPIKLACALLSDNDELLNWPSARKKGWIRTFLPYKKSQWYGRRHIRLTHDYKLYAGNLLLRDILDFVICQNHLYVLTEEEIAQYALPHPSYWNRVILDFQAPTPLKGLEVIEHNDRHLFRITW